MNYTNSETRLSPNARCCVCKQPITDSVSYATRDLAHRWHVRCDPLRLAARPVLVRHPGSCRPARKRPISTPEARAPVTEPAQ